MILIYTICAYVDANRFDASLARSINMESDVYIPFRHGFVTNLSPIPQEWSHSSQESSAKLQSIAETGKLAVYTVESYGRREAANQC